MTVMEFRNMIIECLQASDVIHSWEEAAEEGSRSRWEFTTEQEFNTGDLLGLFSRTRCVDGGAVFTHTVTVSEEVTSEYVGFGEGWVEGREVRLSHTLIVHDDSAIRHP